MALPRMNALWFWDTISLSLGASLFARILVIILAKTMHQTDWHVVICFRWVALLWDEANVGDIKFIQLSGVYRHERLNWP